MKATQNVQNDSLQSVERSKRLVQESQEIGGSTLVTLGEQKEQLIKISQNLDEIDDELKRADKLMRSFMRRMATDRIVSLFTCFFKVFVLREVKPIVHPMSSV
jgi:SNARE protein